MNREFLDVYNRELLLLYEQAKEFAEEYPGIAERLGGLTAERMDPMVSGLLEGTAFLAARVQLKMQHEFPEFTGNLLEQLIPNVLAPTPSCLLLRIKPPYGDPALRDGRLVKAGSYLDATYLERERRVACRFRLASDVTLWPFEVTRAEYLPAAAPFQALGLPADPRVLAGLRLTLRHRTVPLASDEPGDEVPATDPLTLFAGCRTDVLPIHLLGQEADAIALYEQIFANRVQVSLRHLDAFGDPVVTPLPADCIEQIGFEEAEQLLPRDRRVFRGFELLRELFMLPRKFLGFRLVGLRRVLAGVPSRNLDVIITFNEVNSRLAAAVQPAMISLYSAPAINLFEKTTDRVPMRTGMHEYHVVPDRSRYLDYEPHTVQAVFAHRPGAQDKVPVRALYSASIDRDEVEVPLYYTVRRLTRRRTSEERRFGSASDYTGTDMFISVTAPLGLADNDSFSELSIRALCSNRHLTEHLPVGEAGADFRLLNDTSLELACVAGPTRPREPVVAQHRGRSETLDTGTSTWRLINLLSLNHLGLVERGAGRDGGMLREVLFLFADLSDGASERRIRGIRSLSTRPVVRRLVQRTGTGVARGLEVTVTFDEKAFEGSGVFLLGAVLDRFLAEYTHMNHFTQTVIRSVERGEIMRWPPRPGVRAPL
jgi:type VI secretion system protein ImpG